MLFRHAVLCISTTSPSLCRSIRSVPFEWNPLPTDITRFVVEGREAGLCDLLAIVLDDPMGEHVHACTRAASGPELAVDDPLLLARPLDVGKHLLRQRHDTVVRRRGHPVQQPRGRSDHPARAGREKRLDLVGALAYEGHHDGRDVVQVFRHRAADEQVVELRAGGAGGGRGRFEAGRVSDGVHGLADVVEFDVDPVRGERGGHAERFSYF